MRGVSLFMFIVALPALAALSHDIYLFYINFGLDNIMVDFKKVVDLKGWKSLFASLGFIWTQYGAESYKMVVESTDEETWAQINSFLSYKAFFVGVTFAGVIYAILGVLRLLGTWPFKRSEGTVRVSAKKKSGKFEYKRK